MRRLALLGAVVLALVVVAAPGSETVTGAADELLVTDAVFVDVFLAGFLAGVVAAGAAGTALSVAEPGVTAGEPLAAAACDGTAIIEMCVVVPAPAAGGQDLVIEVTAATCPPATAD